MDVCVQIFLPDMIPEKLQMNLSILKPQRISIVTAAICGLNEDIYFVQLYFCSQERLFMSKSVMIVFAFIIHIKSDLSMHRREAMKRQAAEFNLRGCDVQNVSTACCG